MSVHPLSSTRASDPVTQARVHLAAAHRLAVLHNLDEGIDNHFTVTVPGRDDAWLILPFGLHWSEVTASCFMEVGYDGTHKAGSGEIERSCFCIHAPIHELSSHSAATWAGKSKGAA